MANIIEMPKLSDTMTVGTLVKWLKKEGDAVQTGDMLAEVETDKATMELECFFDGTLLKIFAGPGSQVAIGAPLCAIGKPGETVEAPVSKTPAAAAPAAPQPAGAPTTPMQKSDQTKVTAPGASTTSKSEIEPRPAFEPKPATSAASPSPAAPRTDSRGGRVKISPLARKLAAEKGIEPSRVTGSGPGGRIVRADILAAEKSGTAKAGAATGGPLSPRFAAGSAFQGGPIQEERVAPVSNMRGAIARRLVESKTQLPHFYAEIEIDAGPLLALREQLNTGL